MTDTIKDARSLEKRIAMLELQRQQEKEAITAEFRDFKERIKPANMIRSVISSVKNSPEAQADIMHGAVGLATGFLTNQVLLSKVHGPWKNLLSVLLPAGLANVAVKHTDTIKSKFFSALTGFFQSIKLKTDEDPEKESQVLSP